MSIMSVAPRIGSERGQGTWTTFTSRPPTHAERISPVVRVSKESRPAKVSGKNRIHGFFRSAKSYCQNPRRNLLIARYDEPGRGIVMHKPAHVAAVFHRFVYRITLHNRSRLIQFGIERFRDLRIRFT